jgi:carboxypeptidase T
MWQNLTAAKLVGQYGVVKDISPVITAQTNNYAAFTITRLGLANTETFTVSVTPLDDHIVEVGNPIDFDNLDLLVSTTDSINYLLDAGIANGTIYQYLLSIDNGLFVISDTITKFYGTEITVFEDNCEDLGKWTSNKWGTTDYEYHSPDYSITDSPFGDYQENENNIITLDTTINLTDINIAFLRFWAKWDIEKGYDYVQVLAKEEGSNTWVQLSGEYSSYGNYYLDPGDPVYDGVQNDWVQEEINLTDFADKIITLRFKFYSDSYVDGDGFYFDDLTVSVISTSTGIHNSSANNNFISNAYPNPVRDYFSIKYELQQNKNATLELFDAMGNTIRTIIINEKKGVVKINIKELSNGIYYYRIVNDNRVSKSYKIIKL